VGLNQLFLTLHLRRFPDSPVPPILHIMLKRRTSGPKTVRKKKKGNTTYAFTSLDPPNKKPVVEDIRVWNISTSETTGRITANRRTLKHYHQAPPSLPEEPSTSKEPGGVEEAADVEEPGNLADSESPSKIVRKRRPKRKRVRAVKENDSVSETLISPPLWAYPHFRQGWNSGFRTAWLF